MMSNDTVSRYASPAQKAALANRRPHQWVLPKPRGWLVSQAFFVSKEPSDGFPNEALYTEAQVIEMLDAQRSD